MFGINTRRRIELLEQENEILSDRIRQVLNHLELNIRPHFYESTTCLGEECYDELRKKYRKISVDKL